MSSAFARHVQNLRIVVQISRPMPAFARDGHEEIGHFSPTELITKS
jgi:hypothetical protein